MSRLQEDSRFYVDLSDNLLQKEWRLFPMFQTKDSAWPFEKVDGNVSYAEIYYKVPTLLYPYNCNKMQFLEIKFY